MDRNEAWSWPPKELGPYWEVSQVLRHRMCSLTRYSRDGNDGHGDRNSAMLPLEGSVVVGLELAR